MIILRLQRPIRWPAGSIGRRLFGRPMRRQRDAAAAHAKHLAALRRIRRALIVAAAEAAERRLHLPVAEVDVPNALGGFARLGTLSAAAAVLLQ